MKSSLSFFETRRKSEKSSVIILSVVLSLGFALESLAAQITVDESRDLERRVKEYFGPQPLVATAFAPCREPDDFSPFLVGHIFDTGSKCLTINPADEKFVAIGNESCVNVLVNGHNALDPDNNNRHSNVPPAVQLNGLVDGITKTTWDRPKQKTLIGMPIVRHVRALIDNRPGSVVTRTFVTENEGELVEFKSSKIVFNPTEADIPSGPIKIQLPLFRLLDDDPFTVDRLALKEGVAFKNGEQSVEGGQFLFDTGTVFTGISREIAESLGLLARAPDFLCEVNEFEYDGYVIDSVQMKGFVGSRDNLQDVYAVNNARVCVETEEGSGIPRLFQKIAADCVEDPNVPNPPEIGGLDAIIGSNLFSQVHVLLDGPQSTLTILSEPADFDGNVCVDRSDVGLLLAELRQPAQEVNISGFVEVGTNPIFTESGPTGNFTAVEFSADGPVEISSVIFDFGATDVIMDADGKFLAAQTGLPFQRLPAPLQDSNVFGFEGPGFPPGRTSLGWDLDKLGQDGGDKFFGDLNIPQRADYFGGNVTITFSDGSIAETMLNEADSQDITGNGGAAARFSLLIPHFRRPPDPKFDLTGDGTVDHTDARALVSLFTNQGGSPCN